MTDAPRALSAADLDAECGLPLPAKEVVSLLNLNVDLDIALDVAAPIDLAVAAQANAALPIDAAVSANVLSTGSLADAVAAQTVLIDQGITGDASAIAPQTAVVDQTAGDTGTTDGSTDGSTTGTTDGATTTVTDTTTVDPATLLQDGLLNVDVKGVVDAAIAAPIAGAVAAQANIAAPIDAAVAANVLSTASVATAAAEQTAVITQAINGTVTAVADQDATVQQ